MSPKDPFIQEWYYQWCKRKIASYVAREREPKAKIVKALKTLLKDGRLSLSDLMRAFAEVEKESVEPFTWLDYPARKHRLDDLKEPFSYYLAQTA